jgi:hypothetical protein
MAKYCPIMSHRQKTFGTENCSTNCALWDEENNQCCFKTMALAAAGKSSVETKPIYFDIGHPPLQNPEYIPPRDANSTGNPYRIEGSSTCNTDDMIKKLNINIGGSI